MSTWDDPEYLDYEADPDWALEQNLDRAFDEERDRLNGDVTAAWQSLGDQPDTHALKRYEEALRARDSYGECS